MKNKVSIELFEGKDGWRWHAKRSGRIIAECGEGYTRRSKAVRTLNNFLAAIQADAFIIK